MQQNTVNLHSIYASDAPDTPAQTLQPAPPRAHAGQFDGKGDHRLRYFVQRDGAVLNRVLRIFLRAVAHSLAAHSPGAAKVNKAAVHIGAVAFIHRFGSSLNEHVHFMCAWWMGCLRNWRSAWMLKLTQIPKPMPTIKLDELTLKPLELIDRIAALVPPPRPCLSGAHQHTTCGPC